MPQSVGYISPITKNWGRINACARFGEGLITQENIYLVVRAVRLSGHRIVGRYFYFSHGHVHGLLQSEQSNRAYNEWSFRR